MTIFLTTNEVEDSLVGQLAFIEYRQKLERIA